MAEQELFIAKLCYHCYTALCDILLSDKSKLQKNGYREILFL